MKKWLKCSFFALFILTTILTLWVSPQLNNNPLVMAEATTTATTADNELVYLSLGDSIASGYKLPSWTSGNGDSSECNPTTPVYNGTYTKYFEDYLYIDSGFPNKSCISYAKSNMTTTDLINQLSNNQNLKNDIKRADVITISIGIEDIMNLFYEDQDCNRALYSYLLKPITDFFKGIEDIVVNSWNLLTEEKDHIDSAEDVIDHLMGCESMKYEEAEVCFSKKFSEIEKTVSKNIKTILNMISDSNPNAKIILADIYNPFRELYLARNITVEWSDEEFGKMLQGIGVAFKISGWIATWLLGGGGIALVLKIAGWSTNTVKLFTFENFYSGIGNLLEDSINSLNTSVRNAVSTHSNLKIAKVKDAYDNYFQTLDDDYDIVRANFKAYIKIDDDSISKNSDVAKIVENFKTENKANVIYNPTLYGQRLIFETIRDLYNTSFNVIVENYSREVNGLSSKTKIIDNYWVPYTSSTDVAIKNENGVVKYFEDKVVLSKQLSMTSAILSNISSNDNDMLFINWYRESTLKTRLSIPSNISVGLVDNFYAKWSQAQLNTEAVQYVTSFSMSQNLFTFYIDSDNQADWYLDGVLKKSGSNTFNFGSYGTHNVYCKVKGVKSQEFEVTAYYKPFYYKGYEPIAITETIIPPTGDSATITNYSVNLEDSNDRYLDMTKLKWYVFDYVTQEKTEITSSNGLKGDGLGVELTNVKNTCFVTIEYLDEQIYQSRDLLPVYYVTFNCNGGVGDIPSQKFYQGEVLTSRPANPTKSGKVFGGWYFSNGFASEHECKFNESITEDKVLYAKWPQLTHNSDSLIKYYDTTTDIESVRFNMPASSEMEIVWYENGQVISGESSTTLEYIPEDFGEYVIFCKVDGQQSVSYTFHFYQSPTTLSVRRNTITLNKYLFTLSHNSDHIDMSKVKWYVTDDLTNKVELATGETSIEYVIDKPYVISVEYYDGSHFTTYEYDKILPKYVVSYYIENTEFTETEVELGTKLTNHDRVKDGYILKCWYLDNYTYQNKWDFNTPVSQDTKLYAKYVQLENVRTNVLEQYTMEVEQVSYTIELDEEVIWTVYLEETKYLQSLGGSTFSFTPEEGVSGRYTVSCKYREGESNRLTVDVIYYAPSALTIESINKGTNIYDMSIIGDIHSPSIHAQKLQWHKVVNYVDTIFEAGHSLTDYELKEPCTVYLEYTSGKVKVKSNEITISPLYKVEFSSNGEIVHSEHVLNNEFVQHIPEVYNSGMIFVGWYQDSAYTVPYNIGVTIRRDLTIYAKWVKLELENPLLSTQYVNSVEPVVLSIDMQGLIYWYQNGSYAMTTNVLNGKSVFTLTPELGVSRTYYVRCDYYDSETDTLQSSNTQVIQVQYYEPTELSVEKTEPTRNTFNFKISDSNAFNMDPLKFDWYIVVNGNEVKLDNQVEGITLNEYKTELQLIAEENCEVYLKYDGEEVERYSIVPKYHVTYITQVQTPQVEVVERYSKVNPTRVTRAEYIFAGWYTEYTCENKFNTGTEVTEDLTLYAKWVQLKYHGSETILTQYLDETQRVQFYVDLSGVSISWYVNGSRQMLSGSSDVFSYTAPNVCGSYAVTCKINGEESNAVVIKVYAVPTELKISSSKNTNNEVELTISDSDNINGANCVWMKKTEDGNVVEIGTGTKLSAKVDSNYEVYVVYRDTNVSDVVSNTLTLERQVEEEKSSGAIWIILSIVVVIGVAGVVIYFKVIKPRLEERVLAPVVEKQPTPKTASPRVSKPIEGKQTTTTKSSTGTRKSTTGKKTSTKPKK